MVRPILEYCNPVWSPYLKKHHVMLERIQRSATRMILGLDSVSYSERLTSLNITTLYYRRKRQDLIQVFRIINGFDCLNFNTFFEYDSGRTRGNMKKLIKPRANSSTKLNVFSHRVINSWNELPNYVVMSSTINEFKNRLNTYWSNKSFKFDTDY